jgi:hypothetical protein
MEHHRIALMLRATLSVSCMLLGNFLTFLCIRSYSWAGTPYTDGRTVALESAAGRLRLTVSPGGPGEVDYFTFPSHRIDWRSIKSEQGKSTPTFLGFRAAWSK